MNCVEFEAIVAGDREEDLSPDEARAFEEHLETCPACLAAVARAEQDLARLASALEPPVLPASAWASVDAAVFAGIRAPSPSIPVAAPRGEVVRLVLPVVVPQPALAVPVKSPTPALTPAQPRRLFASRAGRPAGFSLAFAAALGALLFSSFVLSKPQPPRSPSAIGRVKPLEAGDTDVVNCEPGEGHQRIGQYASIIVR